MKDFKEAKNTHRAGFVGFASLSSNQAALRLAQNFARGAAPFGFISGASGWGKSHLLKAAAETAAFDANVRLVSVNQAARISSLQTCDLLVIDDVHLLKNHPRSIQKLSMEVERRVHANKPTLCSGENKNDLVVKQVLQSKRRWQCALLEEPTFEERLSILKAMAQNENMELSEDALRLVCRLIKGNGRSLQGALNRLRIAIGPDLRPHLPIRIAGALCPFLTENEEFDLRAIVVDCVSQGLSLKVKREFPNISKSVSVQILRIHGKLPEPFVAQYFGLTSGETFQMQKEAEQSLRGGARPLTVGYERSMSLINRRLRESPPYAH